MVSNLHFVFCFVWLAIIHIHTTDQYGNFRENRRPRVMGNALPMKAIMPTRKAIQRKIVLFHNVFRTRVVPPAANMLRMKYHHGAARAAQNWSDACQFLTHDSPLGRHTDNYGSCGQNIFVASHRVPWLFAIKTWYLEKDNFTFGSKKNNMSIVGHYTQMVWAATHEVGCGLSVCTTNGNFTKKITTYFNYVCNYCPAGNRQGQQGRPYRRGRPCELCKKKCHAKKLCNNSCNAADLWVNCKELYRVWSAWLCHTASPKGKERLEHCKATCTCRNRIHD